MQSLCIYMFILKIVSECEYIYRQSRKNQTRMEQISLNGHSYFNPMELCTNKWNWKFFKNILSYTKLNGNNWMDFKNYNRPIWSQSNRPKKIV